MRKRHPSASWRPDVDRLRARLEAELRARDAPCPEAGAAVLLARGLAGVDVDSWARVAGVSAELVRRAEAGELRPADIPAALRG